MLRATLGANSNILYIKENMACQPPWRVTLAPTPSEPLIMRDDCLGPASLAARTRPHFRHTDRVAACKSAPGFLGAQNMPAFLAGRSRQRPKCRRNPEMIEKGVYAAHPPRIALRWPLKKTCFPDPTHPRRRERPTMGDLTLHLGTAPDKEGGAPAHCRFGGYRPIVGASLAIRRSLQEHRPRAIL